MGGGAPLAFLNKKTWHPGRVQNLEEVWKREQAAAAEQRKLEELRKQYEDERKNAEFTQMAEAAGYKKDAKLDWMYAGSLAAKHEAQVRHDAAAAAAGSGTSSSAAAAAAAAGVPTALERQQQQQQAEAPLMGKAPAPDEHLSRAERAAQLPTFMAAGAPTSQNEQWARLTNDPLLAIKLQEQEALKRVKQNPIKMQQILKEVEKVRSHKHKKKDKKEHKKEHKKDKGSKRSRSRSRSRSPRCEPPAHRHNGWPAAAAAPADGRGVRDSGGKEYHDRSRSEYQHAGGHSSRRHRSRSRSRSRSRDRYGSHSRQQHGGGGSSSRHAQEGAARDSRHDDHRAPDHRGGSSSRHAPEPSREQHGSRHHHHHDSRGAVERKAGYGLDAGRAHAVGGSALAAEAAARAEATRQRLAEAAAAKEAAAAAERAARAAPRESYRAGKMSAEEKAAKLAAMMGNADEHEAQRRDRLAKARAEEDAERKAGVSGLLAKAAAVRAEDAFKSAAAAEVFGSMAAGGVGLDARIGSRRHYNQR